MQIYAISRRSRSTYVLDMVLDDDEDLGGMSSSEESDLDRQLENQS